MGERRDTNAAKPANVRRCRLFRSAFATEVLRSIKGSMGRFLAITGIVNNSHLQGLTDAAAVAQGVEYAAELSRLSGLHVVCSTVPPELEGLAADKLYSVKRYVRAPWE